MVKPLMDQPPTPQKKANGRVTVTRRYELITPLFGGGVKANNVDTDNPIRGTAVRGQLRFWWRATQGTRYGNDLESLKSKEDEIWGSTDNVSKISITILDADPGSIYQVPGNRNLNVGEPRSPLSYVAFPLNQNGEKVYEGASFTLRIDCPKEYRPDVKAALWAWETFGGIGARTRRGFGALHCTGVELFIDDKKYKTKNWEWSYSSRKAKQQILKQIENFTHPDADQNEDIASLSIDEKRTHVTPSNREAYNVWRELIDSLKDFRQSRRLKQIGGRMRPFGRSHWPEPDTIRHLTDQSTPEHEQPVYDDPPIHKFPRAAFGLPIIFEFKDDDDRWALNPNADPRKTELSAAKYERRASRLILKPLKCSDGRFVGLATILNGRPIPPGGLALKNVSQKVKEQPEQPAQDAEKLDPKTEAPQISREMDGNYNGNPDILQAFIAQLP